MKPERCAAVAYSEPVLCDAEAMLVKKGNPKGFKSYADVAKDATATIGAPGGGTEEKLALDCRRAARQGDRRAGRAERAEDAAGRPHRRLFAAGAVDQRSDQEGQRSRTSKSSRPWSGAPVYCDGAAFKKGDEALRDAYDVELAKMKESGEFAKIIEPYGFSAAAAISTSREKQCAPQG